MFRIGEFSKMSLTTIKTLHYYDEVGLLKPAHIDPFTGYRFYTTEQLILLHKIQSFRQIGLSIDEIRQLISGIAADFIMQKRKSELLGEISAKQEQLSRIEFILSGKEEDYFMNYEATIKDLPEYIVYSKRLVAPSYADYLTIIPAIGQAVAAKYPDLKCTAPEYCCVVYLEPEYKEKDIHIEFFEAVEQMKENFDDIVFKKLPQTTVVSVLHRGPYQQAKGPSLSDAYLFLAKWIEDNGYTITGHPRESYIDGIWNKDNAEDWLTEVQFPISKI